MGTFPQSGSMTGGIVSAVLKWYHCHWTHEGQTTTGEQGSITGPINRNGIKNMLTVAFLPVCGLVCSKSMFESRAEQGHEQCHDFNSAIYD